MDLFDTHAHLDDERFDSCRDEVVLRATQAGVTRMIAVGTTLDTSHKCIEIAALYASVFAAVGIQPNYCGEAQADDSDAIVHLAKSDRVVALGETGLDRYWDHTPLEIQRDYFDRHLRLSQQTGLPFIVHMRNCGDDVLEMLREANRRGPLNGVMHSYTGDAELADECLKLGLYISFAGMVTYKKSIDLRAVAGNIPGNRILIETDSPYLSPHPKRGHRPNEPALIVHTAECLAEQRGESLVDFAATTTTNALRFFRLN